MDERRDLVDREELRRRLEENFSESNTHAWVGAHRSVLSHLDAMPAVECPRGWTRDEVLAELDADPDAVCEVQYEQARSALSVPVVRDALARDAQVREIAKTWTDRLNGNDPWPTTVTIEAMASIAALCPSPGDRDDSEEQR